MTFQIWVALHFLLTIDNRKSHWSDFHVVWTANYWTCLSQYRGVKYLAQKERNIILVRVEKLLRLSILNINRCMVILVFYVGYRRGLHFIYLFAVLIQTNTVVVVLLLLSLFLLESAYL